jgi:hypothetical protein
MDRQSLVVSDTKNRSVTDQVCTSFIEIMPLLAYVGEVAARRFFRAPPTSLQCALVRFWHKADIPRPARIYTLV